MKSVLLELEFTPTLADPALYVRRDPAGDLYIMAYVDDLKCATANLPLFASVRLLSTRPLMSGI